MRKKIYNVLNKIYGIAMTVSFFAGILPLIPFVVAIIIGGETGEAISLFLYNEFYPWVIILASVAIIIGLIAMYIAKIDSLSVKSVGEEEPYNENGNQTNSTDEQDEDESSKA